MKIIRSNTLQFIPASHEDPNNPGVLKKVLLTKNDLIQGHVQMINWAKLGPNKAFEKHFHEDMQEVFIILNGKVKIIINDEEDFLEKGDAVLVPIKAMHQMVNESQENVEYLALGIAVSDRGKTINV